MTMKTLPCLLLALHSLASGADIWFTGAQRVEGTAELISSSDINVGLIQANYSGTEGPWTFEVGVGWTEYDLDYVPVLFGSAASLGEETPLVALSLTRQWNPAWSSTVRFRTYDGFSDYRSIWIAEFYKQFFGAFPTYHDPDPHGNSIGVFVGWDYLPGTGSALLAFDYGRDEIAPGWGFNSAIGQPEPGRERLDTPSASLRIEQVINPWLKTEGEFLVRQTTDREARYAFRNGWATAVGPFGFRLTGGYTGESPSFDALYGSALVEWTFLPKWSVHAGYRIYQDSGEIESSGFNALAPGLDSNEFFTGIKWDRGDLAISANVGFLNTDYEPLSEDNEFFGNLYKDRDWVTFRLAASFQF